jgi:hypothetical protein
VTDGGDEQAQGDGVNTNGLCGEKDKVVVASASVERVTSPEGEHTTIITIGHEENNSNLVNGNGTFLFVFVLVLAFLSFPHPQNECLLSSFQT